jgi:uncharacterized protein YfaS (alpha-2-macroglobulin family)
VALVSLTIGGLPAEARSASDDVLRLLRVTPSGKDVPSDRQIVFQFDKPVVPLGRMARTPEEVPIRITPDPGCDWRWLDPSALACQLGEKQPLARSTRYRVRVEPGFQSVDGARLQQGSEHDFITERPAVRYQWFQTWTGPGEPVIRMTFNQAVEGESIPRGMHFRLPDGGRLHVDVELDEERENTWFVRPKRPLPLATSVELRVTPGIQSSEGPERSIADRVLVKFTTFAEQRFLGVRCSDNGGHPLFLEADVSRELEGRRCNPMRPVELVFTAPVRGVDLGRGLGVAPDLAGGRSDFDPWENASQYSRLSRAPRGDHHYGTALPRGLRAWQRYELTAPAGVIRDEFGRPLAQDLWFEFFTDHRPPHLHLGHAASVLESQVPTHLPVVATNLERIEISYDRVTPEGVGRETRDVPVAVAEDVSFRMPLPVRDWLASDSGALLGHMSAQPSSPGQPYWFFSEVTPYQVHVKIGYYNTLVWVTDMADGSPVGDASVEVYADRFDRLSADRPVLARGKTDPSGVALLAGAEALDPGRARSRGRWSRHDEHLFVRVVKGGEMALVPLSHDFRLSARGTNRSWIGAANAKKHGHLKAWGATAQGVYRAGDEIQFKIWVRNEGNERLEPAPRNGYALAIVDPADKKVHEIEDLSLNDYGSFSGSFVLPEKGTVGWYRFQVEAKFAEFTMQPLQVLVADFTPAPFRVTTELQGELFTAGQVVRVDSQARLHAGGPYRDADSRVVARLHATPVRPKDPAAQGFQFAGSPSRSVEVVHRSDQVLDAAGDRHTEFALPVSPILHGSLEVESAVRDDRGKYVAGRSRARYVGRDRYVGLLQPDWVLQSGETTRVLAVVVDEHGMLSPGSEISFTVERRITKAARVKEAGNAYVKRFTHSWESQTSWSVTSTAEPVGCDFTPEGPGSYRITARIEDTKGRESSAELWRWAVGKGQVLWEEPAGQHLEVTPEKEELRVGDTARYLVRNPFPGAKALLTVERYGVLRSWTQTFEESSEIVEFEVEPDFLPGFYLSVVVTSPRVEAPSEDGLEQGSVDLGKPALRIGYAKTEVRDPYKELRIEVEPEEEAYKPRERVTVDIRARTHQGKSPAAELAVAVLDESVFDLIATGRRAYDPYRGFYTLGGLDLWNFNLLKRLIGVQKFAAKGASAGGGGGSDGLRSDFEFVAYWNPEVQLDGRGRARVEFEVPDNLTGWRVLVFGATAGDRMGLGEGTFVVNQPTEIRPALPNQVLEGDRFSARFTVMNRTDAARDLEVRLLASGAVIDAPATNLRVRAEPYQRKAVEFPVEAAHPGEIRFEVRAGDAQDSDGMRTTVPVGKRSSLEVAASYGSTVEAKVSESILFPDDIRTDTGKVSVIASTSALGNLDGAFRYMSEYPYLCWEQRLSKGVMAAHYPELRSWLAEDLSWEGSQELPAQMLSQAANFQAPNGGMVYFVPSDDYVSPYLSAYTALAFDWLRGLGHEVPSTVEEKLHGYLEGLLRRDVFPSFYSKGMASSVRAVALAALARQEKIGLADLDRYLPHAKEMDLFGKAWFLRAATDIDGSAAIQTEVRDAILAHGVQSGGKLVYSEHLDDGYARMLSSALRGQCSILSAFSSLGPEAAAALGEAAPKLVRTITQTRGSRDHWENTQENVFCTNALIDYAQAYEAVEPDFEVEVSLGDRPLGSVRLAGRRAEPVELQRQITARDPGRSAELVLERTGIGRLYYAARLFFAHTKLPRTRANAGIDVRREYSVKRDEKWQRLESPYRILAGELVRVDLFVSLPTARNFVVVDDPVPGGLEPVNRQLATASTVDADEAVDTYPPDSYYFEYDDWWSFNWTRWSFYHRELRHDSARFYSDYLPGGRYHLSYVAQAIATGEFTVLPLRAEEMYDPDIYGRGLPSTLVVGEPAP